MKKMSSSEEEAEFTGDSPGKQQADGSQEQDDDDEDDIPLVDLKSDRKRSAKKAAPSYVDDDDSSDDDSEDDVPLASLMKKTEKVSKKTNGSSTKQATKKTSPKKKTKPAAKKAKTVTKQASTVSASKSTNGSDKKTYESASAALYGSECDKGLLIQRLLCRWWYATTWPDPAKIPSKPPKNYDSLDGFTGVYVCSKGDKVGHILDLRGDEQRPSFAKFASQPSEQLRDLLLKALEKQRKLLVAAEGTGTPTEKELNTLVKWATKLKPDKADRDAAKILKASRLELP
jgi:hypothetical protein